MAESKPVTDVKTLKRLATKTIQNRDKASSELRQIYAIDTETWQGNIFLLADSEGDFIDTFRKGITLDSVLAFLTRKKYETSWNFCYNLAYDASVIIKLLGQELNIYLKTRKLRFKHKEYVIKYYPKKVLSISKNHHSWNFYDIAQFYDFKSLDKAYSKNIKPLPQEYLKFKSKRSQFSPDYYKNNRKQIRKYCITDCKLTRDLAQYWVKLFFEAFDFYPARWISSGYLAEKVLINHGIQIPYFKQLDYNLQEFAYNSYFGGRFEILKRGYIGKAWLLDINSAYPFALTKIPDILKGTWIHGRKSINKNAILGFFKIESKLPDVKDVPCFPFRRDVTTHKTLVFPSGNFVTYCTLEELKACDNPKWYKILDSWQYVDDKPLYPYKEFIEKMYSKRLDLKQKNNPLQLPIKIILNSIYGKTGQKNGRKIGNLFCPVIFSFITGFARAQLYSFVRKHDLDCHVVSFATDSVCITREINTKSDRLGDFSLDKSASDVYYLQNGFYRFNGVWKLRGLGKLGRKEVEHVDTIERNGRLYYQYFVNRTKQLRSSIIQGQISEIGKIKPHERQVDLNADNKRFWLGELSAINQETNNSVPLSLNHFEI